MQLLAGPGFVSSGRAAAEVAWSAVVFIGEAGCSVGDKLLASIDGGRLEAFTSRTVVGVGVAACS